MFRRMLFNFLLGYCLDSLSSTGSKMSDTANPCFKRRRSQEGTYESICLYCFHSVGTGEREAAVVSKEAGHRCADQDLRSHRRLTGRLIR